MRALLALALIGCAQHHTLEPGSSTWPDGVDASVPVSTGDGRPPAETSFGQGPCSVDLDRCTETTRTPIIGIDRFCRAEHQWIPTLNYDRGIHNANELCRRWAVCVEEPFEPCFHCLDAGVEFRWWDETWCGP